MAISSVSYAIRIATASFVVVAVWVTMNSYGETMKKEAYGMGMQDVAELVDAKLLYVLKGLASNSYVKESVVLPNLGVFYAVNISCDSALIINATAPAKGKSYIIKEYFKCSRMSVSGKAFEGDRCMVGNRTNTTHVNIRLVDNC
jgi:hypothetical protein